MSSPDLGSTNKYPFDADPNEYFHILHSNIDTVSWQPQDEYTVDASIKS